MGKGLTATLRSGSDPCVGDRGDLGRRGPDAVHHRYQSSLESEPCEQLASMRAVSRENRAGLTRRLERVDQVRRGRVASPPGGIRDGSAAEDLDVCGCTGR
jgi:hypothetical protein